MTNTTETIPEQPFATFSPEDLVAAVMLIDAASNEGAFKGWENIQKAFTVRQRILAFAEQWNETIKLAEADSNKEENQ